MKHFLTTALIATVIASAANAFNLATVEYYTQQNPLAPNGYDSGAYIDLTQGVASNEPGSIVAKCVGGEFWFYNNILVEVQLMDVVNIGPPNSYTQVRYLVNGTVMDRESLISPSGLSIDPPIDIFFEPMQLGLDPIYFAFQLKLSNEVSFSQAFEIPLEGQRISCRWLTIADYLTAAEKSDPL